MLHKLALVDWGTSNLRLWLMQETGGVLAHTASPQGADKLSPDQFYGVLKNLLSDIGVGLSVYAKLPVMMCGMVGSRKGWVEAEYVAAPVHCQQLPQKTCKIETPELDVRIMPGLCVASKAAPDVMRGEETQLLGLYIKKQDFSGVFCMPGTHSKWGVIHDGVIESFQTSMTGEMFALLAKHSVIRHVIGDEMSFQPEQPEFEQAVLQAYHHPEQFMFNLFPVRAGGLLFSQSGAAASAKLSGSLIGAELASALKAHKAHTKIALIASGKLAQLYRQAFKIIQREFVSYDADLLVQEGLKFAAEKTFLTQKAEIKV